ncbi:MAG TPA: methyltransferase domain-containing protein [Pirellulales bacterium]|nr:methyltransferase domain-containing protein [Pirellulales bacterium]
MQNHGAMPRAPDLSRRRLEPELIDQPTLDAQRHLQALDGLARVNFWSGSAGILWPAIRALAQTDPQRVWRLLDVASGAGDVPIALWRKAQRAGIRLQVEGCDISGRAVEHARRRAERRRADVRFFQCDALGEGLPGGYDIVASSLFLHHLSEAQAAELLRRMAASASRLVLVNDLLRGRAGFVLAYLGVRALTRCDVVHADGPQSVEGAFTLDEVQALCREAGLAGVSLKRRWPCRYLLAWRR